MRREYIFVFAGNEYAHRAFDDYCREKRVSALFFFGEWCGSRYPVQKMVEDIMRIATAAYPITWLNSWDEYEQN